jgi:drug/metabolite transporter (DMT)-like permease
VLALGLGAFFTLGMVFDFQAIKSVGAGLSRVVLFGFPLLVMVLDGVFEKRWPNGRSLVGFLLAWAGLWTIALGQGAGTPSHLGALGWALLSLVCYATYVWLSGRAGQKLGAPRLTFLSNLSTSLCMTLGVTWDRHFEFTSPELEPLAWVGVMVLVSTVVPYYLMNEGIVRLGAARASLVAMTGPVITLAAASLVLGERLTPAQLAGSAALILGVAWAKSSTAQPDRSEAKPLAREAEPRPGPAAPTESTSRRPRCAPPCRRRDVPAT